MTTPYNSNAYLRTMANPFRMVTVTPTLLNADAYDSGDVLFTGCEIAGAVRDTGGLAKLVSLHLTDADDQKVAMDLYLTQLSTAFGTLDAAPSISDANLVAALAQGTVLAIGSIYKDLGGIAIAGLDNINRIVKAASDTTSLYLHAITGGTPTHTTGGLKITLGFQDVG